MINDYDTYKLSHRETVSFCLLIGSLLGFSAFLFYNSPLISILFMLAAYPSRRHYSRHMAEKRKKELMNQFRDLLYVISSSISAGRQMREALIEAESGMKLMYGSKALINIELENMTIRMQEGGETEEVVLRDFASRSHIQDIMSFVDIYSISKSAGSDIERVIRKTVAILLDRIELDKEVKTLTAQKRLEFLILTVMPILTLLFLRISSPSYLSVMYESIAGRILMTFSLLAVLAALHIAFRMTRIEL